jgi:predicted  nucleic acid-binding Zn-ribbon protein
MVKIISDPKGNSNKQINEDKKSIQDSHKKVRKMEEKFSKGMKIMKDNQMEMKTSTNQIKNHIGWCY